MSDTATTGPELPEVKMHLYRPNEPVAARVTRNELCTASKKAAAFVRHLEFDVSGTDLAGNVHPGQSIGVLAPGEDARGRPHAVRLYSVASPTGGETGDGSVISTTVKRTIDEHWEDHSLLLGVASNHLCDLREGDTVMLSGPNGKRFLLPKDPGAHDYLFVATGTGIAPFRGFVIDLLEKLRSGSRVVLLMGSPYETDLLYDDLFNRLDQEHENFTYLTALSRQPQRDGHDKMYVQKRLTTNKEQILPMLHSDRGLVYICGLAGMEVGIFQEMAEHLPASVLEQYLDVDPQAMSDINSWNRKMINKQIKATRRVFLEVYA